MKILVLADVENPLYIRENKKQLSEVDFVISCGDVSEDYLGFVHKELSKDVYFVNGNHLYQGWGRPPEGLCYIDGKVIETHGITIAGIDGIEYYDEEHIYHRVRELVRTKKQIDIFVSHSPARDFGDGAGYHRGSREFFYIYEYMKPKIHVYGHYHLPYGGRRHMEYDGIELINGYDHYIIEL